MNFNINGYVRVRLTDVGRAIHRQQHEALVAAYPRIQFPYTPPSEIHGWSRWQLWQLMSLFGPSMYLGCDPPFETVIEILGEDA